MGLRENALRDADVRVPHAVAQPFIERLVEETGCPELGLLAAKEVEGGHFDLLEVAARSTPTLGVAVDLLLRFFWLVDDGVSLRLRPGSQLAEMQMRISPSLQLHPAYVEFIPAMLLLAGRRETLDDSMSAESIWFEHAVSGPIDPYRELFKGPVLFGASRNLARFPIEHLYQRMQRANPDVCRAAEAALGRDERQRQARAAASTRRAGASGRLIAKPV